MQSDMIGKIEKARRYAEEPERIELFEINAQFHGGNDDHMITMKDGHWKCDCSFFQNWGTCAHVMAMQKVLNAMLPPQAREPEMSVNIQSSGVIV